MITQAKNKFCIHGYSYGFCPKECMIYRKEEEKVDEHRRIFLRQFKQKPMTLEALKARKKWTKMSPETKETFIIRLHQFYYEEKYPTGVPENLLIPKWLSK